MIAIAVERAATAAALCRNSRRAAAAETEEK